MPKEHKIHEGHRKRLRERFVKEGLANFDPHVVLELLLFYSIPQKDTNELAHKILEHFGSLSEVFEAPVSELMKIDGVGFNSAVLLSMTSQLCNVYRRDKKKGEKISGLENIARFASDCFIGMTTEHFLLICMDNEQSVICHRFISEGSVDSSQVDIRKMAEILLGANATAAVIAHNHPRGSATPSQADLKTTRAITDKLHMLGIELLDHVIVSSDDYLSLAAHPRKYGCYLQHG